MKLLKTTIGSIYGYDFFISYCWDDGRHYAVALRDRLKQGLDGRTYSCFLDSEEYEKGADWKRDGQIALNNTSYLIVLVSPKALVSKPVLREVRLFKNRGNRIVPVEFLDQNGIGTLGQHQRENSLQRYIRPEMIRIAVQAHHNVSEPNQLVGPSEDVVKQIVNSFNIATRAQKRLRSFTAATIVLAMVAMLAGVFGYSANVNKKEAEKQTTVALQNEREAKDTLAMTYWNNGRREQQEDTLAGTHLLALAHDLISDSDRKKSIRIDLGEPATRLKAQFQFPHSRQAFPQSVRGVFIQEEVNRIISWTDDGLLAVWDMESHTQVGKDMLHPYIFGKAVVSHDKRLVATWHKDGTARLWDTLTQQPLGPEFKHASGSSGDDKVYFKFGSNAKHLVSWRPADGNLRSWDVDTQRQIGSDMQHGPSIAGVSFDKDTSRILTWGSDRLKLWDISTQRSIKKTMNHDGVMGAVLSKDEQLILSWDRSGFARIWNANTLSQMGNALPHGNEFRRGHFNNSGTRVLTWTDQSAKVWNTQTQSLIGPDIKHPGLVHAEFNGDETMIRTWNSKSARLWDAETLLPARPRITFQKPAEGVKFSKDDQRLLTWSNDKLDGYVQLWNLDAQSLLGPEMKHDGIVRGAIFSHDENSILSWGDDGTVRVWEIRREDSSIPSLDSLQTIIGFHQHPSKERLLTWAKDGTFQLWSTRSRLPTGSIIKHGKTISGALIFPHDDVTLTWGDEKVRLWDVGHLTQSGRDIEHKLMQSVALNADYSRLLTLAQGAVKLWDLTTTSQIGSDIKHGDVIAGAIIGADSSVILTWGGTKAKLWDADSQTQKGPVMQHNGTVIGAHFLKDGKQVLTWDNSGDMRLWDAASQAQIGKVMQNGRPVRSAAFNSDSSLILSSGSDGTARLWSTETQSQIGPSMTHRDHRDLVHGAIFNKDESHVLTWAGGLDFTVRLWDSQNQQQIGTEMKHNESVTHAAFSNDESRIISWSRQGVRLWDARTQLQLGTTMKPLGQIIKAEFNADESLVFVLAQNGQLTIWEVPRNIDSSPSLLSMEIEALTGTQYDTNTQTVRVLGRDEWKARLR